MTGIVTWAGLDVHARSTYAAIDASTGELRRARFGPGVEERVAWLQSLPGPVGACRGSGAPRGVDTLTAFVLHLELGGDWQRFQQANALSAWLGLIPSLHQSGESSHQGSITKTGSAFARRLLVESRQPGTTRAPHGSARHCKTASRANPIMSCRSPTGHSSGFIASISACGRAASRTTWSLSRALASSPASSGQPQPSPEVSNGDGRLPGAGAELP